MAAAVFRQSRAAPWTVRCLGEMVVGDVVIGHERPWKKEHESESGDGKGEEEATKEKMR